MNFVIPNFAPAMPEILLLVLASIVLIGDTVWSKRFPNATYYATQLSLLITGWLILSSFTTTQVVTFDGSFVRDAVSDVLKLFIVVISLGVFLFSKESMGQKKFGSGEYYVLGLFAVLGMFVMVSAYNLITLYLGLEIMSLSLYAIIALHRNSGVAVEASSKYFVLGALATGMLLYGFSMVYGATGQINFDKMAAVIASGQADHVVLAFGLVFVIIGLVFKMGGAPFHMWMPDVYHGAPTAVTLFLGTAPKIAAFAMLYRLLVEGMPGLIHDWQQLLIIVSVVSMVVGAIAAIAQANFKRMLAYSGIGHVGFILLGFIAGTFDGYASAMYYVIIYAFTGLAGFGIMIALGKGRYEFDRIEDFKGLNARNPWLALMMLFVLFSMAGVPPFVGFFAKLLVIEEVVKGGFVWLAIVAVITAVISAFYYLRVVKMMYFDKPDDETSIEPVSKATNWTISFVAIALLVFGLFPSSLINLVYNAVAITH
jgi:NADH-quinone oxidoreductase subunit N